MLPTGIVVDDYDVIIDVATALILYYGFSKNIVIRSCLSVFDVNELLGWVKSTQPKVTEHS